MMVKATKTTALTVALAAAVAGCGGSKPDYSKNEGAVAWLAHHDGTIPRACVSEMVEKYGESTRISDEARQEAEAKAMEFAGETYALALASERLISAEEKVVAVAREGYAKGYVTESGVYDAIDKLNEAISDRDRSRFRLAGLDACEFTATDEAFGFQTRMQVSYSTEDLAA